METLMILLNQFFYDLFSSVNGLVFSLQLSLASLPLPLLDLEILSSHRLSWYINVYIDSVHVIAALFFFLPQ